MQWSKRESLTRRTLAMGRDAGAQISKRQVVIVRQSKVPLRALLESTLRSMDNGSEGERCKASFA